jgi:pyruvate carboxylase subunit B
MPGKVVRILVDVGDSVNFDQGLLVLEAMKMQNEIRAPKSGVVKEIGVVEGKAVNSGDLLVSLE